MSDEWTEATFGAEKVEPGEAPSWVEWFDGEHFREEPFRPIRDGEIRCDQRFSGDVCCLALDHLGPHIRIGEDRAAVPFIVGP